jgi:THO complex subunit 2
LFLASNLAKLASWHKDRALYEKEAVGVNPRGFLKRWSASAEQGQEPGPEDILSYEDFRQALYKWHLKFRKVTLF